MSTEWLKSINWNRFFSPSVGQMVLTWLILSVVAYLIYSFTGQQTVGRDRPTNAQILSAPESKGNTSPSPSTPNEYGQAVALPTPPPRPTPEDVAAAKMRWIDFKGQIEDIREDLAPALADTEGWTTLVKQLPTNEAGKRIAGSEAHVDQYSVLLEQPRQPARLAGQYHDALQVHLETAQTYLGQADNATTPTSAVIQDITRLKGDVKTLKTEYRRDRLALEKLVSETASVPPAELTLEKVVEQREKDVAGEYLAQLAAARAAAEAEAQQRLREAEEKAIKQKAEAQAERLVADAALEARRIRDEAEQRDIDEKAAAAKKNRENEARRLRALAEDPEVKKQFACFLEKGYLQFTTMSNVTLDKSQRPAPVSFGDLDRHGWLKKVENFAKAMSPSPADGYGPANDRPTRAYPTTDAEWAEMDRLLEQFKTIGPIWVEMQWLRP